jgi:hypothetical protein
MPRRTCSGATTFAFYRSKRKMELTVTLGEAREQASSLVGFCDEEVNKNDKGVILRRVPAPKSLPKRGRRDLAVAYAIFMKDCG